MLQSDETCRGIVLVVLLDIDSFTVLENIFWL